MTRAAALDPAGTHAATNPPAGLARSQEVLRSI
jgi:hypothetical protein